jgi:hypothetical protein
MRKRIKANLYPRASGEEDHGQGGRVVNAAAERELKRNCAGVNGFRRQLRVHAGAVVLVAALQRVVDV